MKPQMMTPILLGGFLKAQKSVRPMKSRKTAVVPIRVLSVMFWNWRLGPQRNMELKSEIRLPNVYTTPKAIGEPIRNQDTMLSSEPMPKQPSQPYRRCRASARGGAAGACRARLFARQVAALVHIVNDAGGLRLDAHLCAGVREGEVGVSKGKTDYERTHHQLHPLESIGRHGCVRERRGGAARGGEASHSA